MDGPKNRCLRARRLLLENPYAHLEQLEELRVERLYENPYLYADQRSADNEHTTKPRKAHSASAIEEIVTRLQLDIWARRTELGVPADSRPMDILEAEYAAHILGYSYAYRPSLGWITHGRDPIIAAGLIDSSERSIEVATDVDPRVARFTGAHEIGHALLHPHLTGLHRDRPLTGRVRSRDRIECEADKFAAFFLMPRKLVLEQFLLRFIAPFNLDEQTSFALLGRSSSSARELLPTRRHISLALASAPQFNGRNFVPLADCFGVSADAMAIRLEELRLIDG